MPLAEASDDLVRDGDLVHPVLVVASGASSSAGPAVRRPGVAAGAAFGGRQAGDHGARARPSDGFGSVFSPELNAQIDELIARSRRSEAS